MPDLKLRTTSGDTAALSPSAINHFTARLHGQTLTPDAPGYDAARTIWNGMIDRRPGLIARCVDPLDVVEAVRFAAEHHLLVSIRGGGHNIAGKAVCDGGLMIDLSRMKAVHVDAGAGTARVDAGATLGDVDRATQAFGLATPVGINSTTGIAGLTLGGGFGWLSRRFGLSIDNLLSIDVVTAQGEPVTVSERERPDLFWALRGGGGNFGVVTSFEFKLHRVGPQVFAGLVVHPLDAARDVLGFYRQFLPTTPEEFTAWVVMRQAPPFPFLAEKWHGKDILALALFYGGEPSQGERITRPLREYGRPIADVVGPTPFTAWQMLLDEVLAPGMRNYWKTHDFRRLDDGLIDVLIEQVRRIPDPQTEIALAHLGGAVARVPQAATAYTHRDAEFVMNVHGRWADPAKDQACIGWAREVFAAATPFATGGAYVNFLTEEEQDRVPAAYGENYARLLAIKNKYDPINLFRVNQNIRAGAGVKIGA